MQSGAKSQSASIVVQREQGTRLIVMKRDPVLGLEPFDIDALATLEIEAVFSDGYEVEETASLVHGAKSCGIPVFLDLEYGHPKLVELLPDCHTAFVSAEAELPDERENMHCSAPTTIFKLGSEGAKAFGEGQELSVPALPIEAIDTTGAGDAFDAGYLSAWLAGHQLSERMAFACRAGAAACSAVGGQIPPESAREIAKAIQVGSLAPAGRSA
ncbi:MAG: PfkB family carbohydrate kinase [Erythrobacter sp.]|nr:PfkB family carbohydrate kinase [Erythrobacter sp.]